MCPKCKDAGVIYRDELDSWPPNWPTVPSWEYGMESVKCDKCGQSTPPDALRRGVGENKLLEACKRGLEYFDFFAGCDDDERSLAAQFKEAIESFERPPPSPAGGGEMCDCGHPMSEHGFQGQRLCEIKKPHPPASAGAAMELVRRMAGRESILSRAYFPSAESVLQDYAEARRLVAAAEGEGK